MNAEPLAIRDVMLITPAIHRDDRGFFSEVYSRAALRACGLDSEFVQDNHALSRAKNVVRGLHCQVAPFAQGKLVRVTRGAVYDVAVDVRRGSPTYGRHVAVVLSEDNWRQVWIPPGFAHGYCTLRPDTELLYKVTAPYAPAYERTIAWNDPALAIAWPVAEAQAILSAKDASAPSLKAHEGNLFD
jgi:dTDP-4-dehydrorhamnose 3,5-epimerase